MDSFRVSRGEAVRRATSATILDMSFVRLRVVAIFVAASIATGYAFQSSPANRPWPPGVQTVPDHIAGALAGRGVEDVLHAAGLPPRAGGRRAAGAGSDCDGLGSRRPSLGGRDAGVRARISTRRSRTWIPIGRIVVLEDTNNDGRMDKRTVFADGLVLARSLKVLDHGVLVGEPPNVWLMHDTNGDLKMDTKELVTEAYGRREGRVEQNANGFLWAHGQLDAHGQCRCLPPLEERQVRGPEDAVARRMGRHAGRRRPRLSQHELRGAARRLRPDVVLRAASQPAAHARQLRPLDDDDDRTRSGPSARIPATNRSYQFGILRDDRTLAAFTSVCAPLVYRGDRLPAELHGNVFVAEPAANVVSRFTLKDDGSTLRLSKAYARAEFLASTDERFRPVFLSDAPDGTLYIVDMYRGVIQQRADITEYLRDQIMTRKLESPTGLGRIYRVMHETTKRASPPPLSKASTVAAHRHVVRSERLVAGHGAAAAGRARRSFGRPSLEKAVTERQGLADAHARALDARRHRRASGPRW